MRSCRVSWKPQLEAQLEQLVQLTPQPSPQLSALMGGYTVNLTGRSIQVHSMCRGY
jgi:hypothetical protein